MADRLLAWLVGALLYHHVPAFRKLVDDQVAADERERDAIRAYERR